MPGWPQTCHFCRRIDDPNRCNTSNPNLHQEHAGGDVLVRYQNNIRMALGIVDSLEHWYHVLPPPPNDQIRAPFLPLYMMPNGVQQKGRQWNSDYTWLGDRIQTVRDQVDTLNVRILDCGMTDNILRRSEKVLARAMDLVGAVDYKRVVFRNHM